MEKRPARFLAQVGGVRRDGGRDQGGNKKPKKQKYWGERHPLSRQGLVHGVLECCYEVASRQVLFMKVIIHSLG